MQCSAWLRSVPKWLKFLGVSDLRRLSTLEALPDEPPKEFRIFRRGVNASTQGDFIFDKAAAAAVMADFNARGVDLAIDLEHQSMDTPIRPDSWDARGWFRLAVRMGELWGVDVRWAPDGARRLREKTQRYLSPTFKDDANGRVLYLRTAGLVASPSTHDAQPLVAASDNEVDDLRRELISKLRECVQLRADKYVAHAKANNGSR